METSDSFLPGEAHLPRAWWVLKKRRPDDLTAWLFCSFAQEAPSSGPEQLTATTRRRLAMMHTRPTHTPGGAQRDRQHPSWSESREAGEGRAVITRQHIYPPSTLNTHTTGHTLPLHCSVHLNPKHIILFTSNKHVYKSTKGVFSYKHYNTHFKL